MDEGIGGGGGGIGPGPVSPPKPVLVLGVGNILLADEGIGVRVIEAFGKRYAPLPAAVEVIDGGTAGMALIDVIAGRRHLIVVDAVAGDGPAGSVVRLAGSAVAPFLRQRLSPHQLGLLDVLAYLALVETAPETVTIIGITPQDLDLGLALSPALAAALDSFSERVADELASLGFDPRPPAAAEA